MGESHHAALTLALLDRPGCDVLASLPQPQQREAARAAIRAAILGTDMGRHNHLVAELTQHGPEWDVANEADRLLMMQVDVSVRVLSCVCVPYMCVCVCVCVFKGMGGASSSVCLRNSCSAWLGWEWLG